MANRKLFVPQFNPGMSPVKPGPAFQNMNLSKNVRAADAMFEVIQPGYKQKAMSAAQQAASAKINNLVNKTSTPGPANGTGGSLVFTGSKPNPQNATYALSPAPNPKPISLNSGIKPNTFVNDYMTPMEGLCSPLHVTGVTLQIPTAVNNPLNTYFDRVICFDVQTRAQANVGFGVDIGVALSSVNLITTFNATIYALQVYFFYSSILSYESNSKNKNAGMIALRQKIDSQTMSDLVQLGKKLEDTPCPPRVVQWVRYMMGNFLSGNTQGSPLLKLTPSSNCLFGTITTTFPAQALAGISATIPTNANVLMRRCLPTWRIGKLYDCPTVPTFDKNFLSIFANLPNVNRQAATLYYNNSVLNNYTAVPYCSYSNNLDGLAFAMSTAFDSAASIVYPGLAVATPVNATYVDNRYSYYTVGATTSWYAPHLYPFLAFSRPDTTAWIATTPYTLHSSASDKCQNVTGQALMQSAQSTVDYLFDTSSVKIKSNIAQYSSN